MLYGLHIRLLLLIPLVQLHYLLFASLEREKKRQEQCVRLSFRCLWLPKDETIGNSQTRNKSVIGDTTLDCYVPFTELCHSTHLQEAVSIFQDEKLQAKQVET